MENTNLNNPPTLEEEQYQNLLMEIGTSPQECTNYHTNRHPMSPSLFAQLSQVQGFNEMNGKDYVTYLQKWKKDYDWAQQMPQLN